MWASKLLGIIGGTLLCSLLDYVGHVTKALHPLLPNTSALSSPRQKVLILLKDLIDSQHTNLRICVTSRPEADIKVVLEPKSFRSVSLQDERGQKEDIKNYIEWVISTNMNMQRWKAEHKQLVIDVLTKRADGM
jgi:hypothetical protein